MPRLHPLFAVLLTVLQSSPLGATQLARVFDSHMVLQRGQAVPIFGTDTPGQVITLSFAGQEESTTTDADGHWHLELEALAVSTKGRSLTVTGSSTVTATDVLVGEVWLAAGQSNMDWMVKQSSSKPQPAQFPLIRMANWNASVGASGGLVYKEADFAKLTPDNYYSGTWETLNDKSVLPQSAVAYFFANALARELKNTPIGIIDISRGGTLAEAFIAPEVLKADPYLKAAFEDPRGARTTGQWAAGRIAKNLTGYTHSDPTVPHPHPFAPGFLYEASMTHIIPFNVRGVLWYQGESNAEFTTGSYQWNGNRLSDYQFHILRTLVTSWRNALGKPELPFYQVQLPRIKATNRALWPYFREAQSRLAAEFPGVEQAVVTEFGINGSNVHPPNKEPVGERLALIALNRIYRKNTPYSGPVLLPGMKTSGDKITLKFSHPGKGLTTRDGKALRGFEIAGKDRQFIPANAKITNETVVVSAEGLVDPVAVRYAWHMNTDGNLANAEGLTASPFRTDRWIAAPGRPLRVACIGDSITQGVGVKNPTAHSYTAQLATLLGENYEVGNFGKSGAGVHRPKNKYDKTTQYRKALAFQPDIVICNLGINDITHWGSYDKEDFLNEYRNLVDAFAASGQDPLIIIWHSLAPLYPGQKFYKDPNVKTLNAWVAEAAALTGVLAIDMAKPLSDHPEWFPDHIHPNEAGARVIAEETFRFLQKLEAQPGT